MLHLQFLITPAVIFDLYFKTNKQTKYLWKDAIISEWCITYLPGVGANGGNMIY